MRSIFLCLIALSAGSIRAAPLNATTSSICKCVPGDSCWPSTADFLALNDTLSGHLIQGVPPAIVCYFNEPQYNEKACEVVLDSWLESTFHATDPISIGNPWYANNTCPPIYPNGTSVTGDPNAGSKGCSIGGYPVYSVNATSEDYVIAAVKFAKEKNIGLNVKSTGHSCQGRSTAFGSLSVWTHYMRGIEYHESFEPDACPLNKTQMAFTIKAGERGRDVYEATNEHQAVVVAGSAQDVGIVGHFSSGGHGPLSSTYGLSADNVLEIRIVTPDRELRTANPCTNSDLFWALRGGGGGTFGVVTSITMKAYPSPQGSRHTFSLSATDPNNTADFWDTGYSTVLPPGLSNGENSSPTWGWFWGFNLYDKPNGTAEALFAPIAEKLNSLNGTSIIYTSSVQWYPSFFALWNDTIGPEAVATGAGFIGSRLLPTKSLADQKHTSAMLQEIATMRTPFTPVGGILQPFLVANNQTGLDGSTSMTPAWGDAVLHFVVAEGVPDNSTFAEAQPGLQDLKERRIAPLKSLAPDSGSYQNEVFILGLSARWVNFANEDQADPFDLNWQYDFFGSNYARLKKIKQTCDPDSLLWCISCVGSEDWAPEPSGKLCKLPWAELEDNV